MNARILAALAAVTMLVTGTVCGAEIIGKVVGVHDADSITVRVPGSKQLKMRLEGIDAPELGQDFGSARKRNCRSSSLASKCGSNPPAKTDTGGRSAMSSSA